MRLVVHSPKPKHPENFETKKKKKNTRKLEQAGELRSDVQVWKLEGENF